MYKFCDEERTKDERLLFSRQRAAERIHKENQILQREQEAVDRSQSLKRAVGELSYFFLCLPILRFARCSPKWRTKWKPLNQYPSRKMKSMIKELQIIVKEWSLESMSRLNEIFRLCNTLRSLRCVGFVILVMIRSTTCP